MPKPQILALPCKRGCGTKNCKKSEELFFFASCLNNKVESAEKISEEVVTGLLKFYHVILYTRCK